MGNKISEDSVVQKIKRYVNSLPNAKLIKRPASMARNGEPDLTGCVDGKHIEIEVKAPGNKPTELQLKRLEEWDKVGAVAFWADDVEIVKRTFGIRGLV